MVEKMRHHGMFYKLRIVFLMKNINAPHYNSPGKTLIQTVYVLTFRAKTC